MKGIAMWRLPIHFLRYQRTLFIKTVFLGIAAALISLPIPMLVPLLVDEVILQRQSFLTRFLPFFETEHHPWVAIVSVGIALLTLRSLATLIDVKKRFYALQLSQKAMLVLRKRSIRRFRYLTYDAYTTLKTGTILSKVQHDIEVLGGLFAQIAIFLIPSVLTIAGVLAILFVMDWRLASIVILVQPAIFLLSRRSGKKGSLYLKRRLETNQAYQDMFVTTLDALVQIRASAKERIFFRDLNRKTEKMQEASMYWGKHSADIQQVSNFILQLNVDLFRLLGVATVVYGEMSIGTMMAFWFYLSMLTMPVRNLSSIVIALFSSKSALESIERLFQSEKEPYTAPKHNPFDSSKGVGIECRNLSFGYSQSGFALRDIDLSIRPGEHIAIVGKSGSGKSTLVKLLIGLYLPRKGEIRYGGYALQEVGLQTIRNHVGVMMQEPFFFDDTILFNLTFGESFEEDRIYRALETVGMRRFVRSLPDGLSTRMGKGGVRLSGGQKQRLVIARLILENPRVVIFDEATSSLDRDTERELLEKLQAFLEDKTVIYVTHRLSLLRYVDRVVTMEAGRIVACEDDETFKRKRMSGD